MSRVAYVNGQYVAFRDARVHVEDRAYQFADGVYEVVFLAGGRPVDEALHLARLRRSLAALRIVLPLGDAALRLVLREVARRNRLRDGLLYMQVSRGVARREHAFPPPGVAAGLVVTARRAPPPPADVARWTGTAITHPDERWRRCDIKSVSLLPNVLARQAAREAGAAEAILVDGDGMVTEGAATTAWIVDQGGRLRTRPLDHAVLPGCTRAALLDMLRAEGLACEERGFSLAELRAAREVFLTSASSFVKPLLAVDGVPVGDGGVGPVARRLYGLLTRHVRDARRNKA